MSCVPNINLSQHCLFKWSCVTHLKNELLLFVEHIEIIWRERERTIPLHKRSYFYILCLQFSVPFYYVLVLSAVLLCLGGSISVQCEYYRLILFLRLCRSLTSPPPLPFSVSRQFEMLLISTISFVKLRTIILLLIRTIILLLILVPPFLCTLLIS